MPEIAFDATYAVWLKTRLWRVTLDIMSARPRVSGPAWLLRSMRSCVLVDMTTQPAPHPLSGHNTSNNVVSRLLRGVWYGSGCGVGVKGPSKSCMFGSYSSGR